MIFIKRLVRRFILPVVHWVGDKCLSLLAPIVRLMAVTGAGTNACLRFGCLPMPVHFYSPVPDIKELDERSVWDRVSTLPGVRFEPDRQSAFLAEISHDYGRECAWPAVSKEDLYDYHTENGGFCYGCAAMVHCVIRHFKPGHIVEIGSGYSSIIINDAVALNDQNDADYTCAYEIVDPYPSAVLQKKVSTATRVIPDKVEYLDPSYFDALGENDVLFIDSGHTVRIGGDVNYLILEILPRLKAGVLIHFHDIPMPSEYSRVYFTNPRFRMLWTESYLLQAFLVFNDRFEILAAMGFLMSDHLEEFRKAFPAYDPKINKATSSSFWLRSLKTSASVSP